MIQISEIIRSHEKEIDSRRVDHESELAKTARDVQALASADKKRLADAYEEQLSGMQSEIHAVQKQLKDSEAKWESRPSLPKDVQLIESLEQEIKALATAEKQAKEKMMYFKRELENRDTNFNSRFTCNDEGATKNPPLRVIQKQERTVTQGSSSNSRRKVRGKVGGTGTRKKKASTSSKLPKVTK